MGVQVADTLAWLSDELRSECSQPVLQRARGIANQWRSKMEDLHCLNDTASNRITLYATIRGTTSPSSRYEVQATLDFADELFLARYCSCPAFSGSQRGYGSYRTFDYHNSPKYRSFDDDDDYDYVDDYDDFGSGSTYGHVNDDDDSASSTSRRYTGMCKHVAAMLLLFLQQPERFRGFHAAAATPRALADYMRSLDAKKQQRRRERPTRRAETNHQREKPIDRGTTWRLRTGSRQTETQIKRAGRRQTGKRVPRAHADQRP